MSNANRSSKLRAENCRFSSMKVISDLEKNTFCGVIDARSRLRWMYKRKEKNLKHQIQAILWRSFAIKRSKEMEEDTESGGSQCNTLFLI